VLADDVVVMVAAGIDALVPGGIAADVNPLDQAESLELLEGPVDGRSAHAPQAPVDLQRGQRTTLAAEQLHHLAPPATAPEAGFGEDLERGFDPARFGPGRRATHRACVFRVAQAVSPPVRRARPSPPCWRTSSASSP